MATRALLTASLALPLAAQVASPPVPPRSAVEVLAAGQGPSELLRDEVRKGGDDLLLVDIGYFIDSLVISLREDWRRIERLRARALADLLAGMQATFRRRDRDASRDCEAVIEVGLALLADRAEVQDAQPEVQAEVQAVRAGASSSLRFVRARPVIDWAAAVPRGAYAQPDTEGLFRATVYLRANLERFPAEQRAVWDAAVAEHKDTEATRNLRCCDAALALLLGTPAAPAMPGMLGQAEMRDTLLLEAMREDRRHAWAKLDAVFGEVTVPGPDTVRDGVLELAHVLATEPADAEMCKALGPERWRRKWADCAAYVYVGMRELDPLLVPVGREDFRFQPHVLVEPVPHAWHALRRLASLCEDLSRALTGRKGFYHVEAIGTAIEALTVQGSGRPLDERLEESLRHMLLWGFEAGGPESSVPIEGVQGALRRARPNLVRLPVRWQGESRTALAVRIFVEHEVSAGRWELPPWGIDLQAVGESAAKERAK